MSGLFLYLLFLFLPTGLFDSPNSNEINGSFAYETDIKKTKELFKNIGIETN